MCRRRAGSSTTACPSVNSASRLCHSRSNRPLPPSRPRLRSSLPEISRIGWSRRADTSEIAVPEKPAMLTISPVAPNARRSRARRLSISSMSAVVARHLHSMRYRSLPRTASRSVCRGRAVPAFGLRAQTPLSTKCHRWPPASSLGRLPVRHRFSSLKRGSLLAQPWADGEISSARPRDRRPLRYEPTAHSTRSAGGYRQPVA